MAKLLKYQKKKMMGLKLTVKSVQFYNHELVFGHLRSSSNYDDTVVRQTSGKNGLGVKCTNILSKSFKVIGVDPENKKKFVQEWTNNMKETSGPKVTMSSLKTGYTEVIYCPDFERLGNFLQILLVFLENTY